MNSKNVYFSTRFAYKELSIHEAKTSQPKYVCTYVRARVCVYFCVGVIDQAKLSCWRAIEARWVGEYPEVNARHNKTEKVSSTWRNTKFLCERVNSWFKVTKKLRSFAQKTPSWWCLAQHNPNRDFFLPDFFTLVTCYLNFASLLSLLKEGSHNRRTSSQLART